MNMSLCLKRGASFILICIDGETVKFLLRTLRYVHIILKKTHFNFREIEKPSGLLCFLYTRFLHCFLAVRASRHSRNGRFAVQGGLFRNAITALLQGETALSAFLTKPCCCNMLIISAPCLKQKTRFSEPCPEIAIRMSLNIR